jgi:tetratricopeptide (TPR) repeat protein
VLPLVAFAALFAQMAFAQPASVRASALIDAGIDLSHRGKFNEAADKFVQALAVHPNSAEAHYLLGLVRQQSGRNDVALTSFRSAVRIHPKYGAAQARICELTTVAARNRESGYESAKAECRRAIALNPKDAEPHFHLGWNESRLGNRGQAIQQYQTVLRLDAGFPHVKFELAMAWLDAQRPDLAIPLLKDVVEAKPADLAANYQLGAALARQGDCAAAIPFLESATPGTQSLYVLANCYKKVNRDEDARVALAKIRQLREGANDRLQAKYKASVAHKHAEAGRLEEAIAEYKAVLALDDDLSVKIDLAVALLKKGEAEEVVRMFANEQDSLARYQLALAYFKLGRLNEAAGTLKSVVQVRPEFVEAWYQLGLSSLGLGRTADAESLLRKATQLRPDEPAIRIAWAEALERSGRVAEARQQRELAAQTEK